MSKRHEAVGIKQVIRFEWMQQTANLLLAGLDSKAIRQELHRFLADQRGSGFAGDRGGTSRTQVVNLLMKIWITPDSDISRFRDVSLDYLHQHPSMSLPVHWGMICAAYPFWFNVAQHTGRLLSLQDQVTQIQVFSRLKEQYGDRETVSRYARYAIRSFVAWGVLHDSGTKGCYQKASPVRIADPHVAIMIFESALLANPEAKSALRLLTNNPAFFPFRLPTMSGDLISQQSGRIEVVRYGLDDEILKLNGD